MKKYLIFSYFLLLILFSGCGGGNSTSSTLDVDDNGFTSFNSSNLITVVDEIVYEELSTEEIESLIYMREEEKLARDVYITLYEQWNIDIFKNISNSKQTHTDAVKVLLDKYSLDDPSKNDAFGIFKNTTLQVLYDNLTSSGSVSLQSALNVGAEIEEIDIIDLQSALDNTIDNEDIKLVYESLMKGSRNHLRAFVKQLDSYELKHLSQVIFDEIINSKIER